MASRASSSSAYIFLSGTVIIFIFFVFVIARPQFNDILDTRQDIKDTRQEVLEQQVFLSTIDRKLEQLQSQAVHEQKLSVILPLDAREEDILRLINQIGQISGVNITDIRNQTDTSRSLRNARLARGEQTLTPQSIDPLAWSVDFTGTYQQFRAFIEELERSPRLLDTETISLRRNLDVPDQLTVKLQLIFYKQAPNPNPVGT